MYCCPRTPASGLRAERPVRSQYQAPSVPVTDSAGYGSGSQRPAMSPTWTSMVSGSARTPTLSPGGVGKFATSLSSSFSIRFGVQVRPLNVSRVARRRYSPPALDW